MRKLLFLLVLFASSVFAQTTIDLDTHGLTTEQKAQLASQVEQMKAQSSNTVSSIKPEVVDQWVSTGEHLGKMMGGAAKEVGLAVNDFVKTPVGIMTAFLVLWNYMGAMMFHLVAGLTILIVGSVLVRKYARGMVETTIDYDLEKTNLFGNHPKKLIQIDRLDGENTGGMLLAHAVVLGVSLVTLFAGW